MSIWEKINLTTRTEKQVRIKKESNIINSVCHKVSKMNKGERKKDSLKQPEEKQENDRNNHISLTNNSECKWS
jgi:hypothetical protein